MGELVADKHVRYILAVEKKKDNPRSFGEAWHCGRRRGVFGGNVGHDPHILYTLSAVQVLALFDKIHMLDIDMVAIYITGLQNEDGSFSGDIWGEVDTRFSYIAISALSLLHQLDRINVEKAVNYISSIVKEEQTDKLIQSFSVVFCCVVALAITGSLHHSRDDGILYDLVITWGTFDGQDHNEYEYEEDVCDAYGQLLEDHYKGTHLGSDTLEGKAILQHMEVSGKENSMPYQVISRKHVKFLLDIMISVHSELLVVRFFLSFLESSEAASYTFRWMFVMNVSCSLVKH
ncbi:hypothetical protein Dimus_009630 [Dionaea muscipula]